jgi:hypothetical protein
MESNFLSFLWSILFGAECFLADEGNASGSASLAQIPDGFN